jgi:SpoIID/LytB domain protein
MMMACLALGAVPRARAVDTPSRSTEPATLERDLGNLRQRQFFIRIGIGTDLTQVTLSPTGPFAIHDAAGKVIYDSKTGATVTFGPPTAASKGLVGGLLGRKPTDAAARVEARDAAGKVLAQGTDYLGVALRDVAKDQVRVQTSDTGKKDAGKAYRCHMEVRVNGKGRFTLVNRIFLEYYLYGVVGAEIGDLAPLEAKKAQAVAARSEAIAKMRQPPHAGEGYDLCDGQHCQAYKGVAAEEFESCQAVDLTRGQVLVYNNEVADAVYSSSCGGVTSNAEDVWEGGPYAYQRSRIDTIGATSASVPKFGTDAEARKWIESSPDVCCNSMRTRLKYPGETNFRWTRSFTPAQIASDVGTDGNTVTDVRVAQRGSSGRVMLLEVVLKSGGTRRIKWEYPIRLALDLPSGFFVIDTARDTKGQPTKFTFTGAGYGHGVGLCQLGAIGMAQRNADYQRILLAYYENTQLYRLYK